MIIDLQRRLAEIGRIRIGQQVPVGTTGKTRPAKLETFRLTSPDKARILAAAKLYGGEISEWAAPAGPQWEVVTDSTALPVIVPPTDMAFTQFYELWSGGGCQRRCDGRTESITESPCLCDPGDRECSIHTRLSVMLRDLPGLGLWRLDTQGWNAALELQGAVEILQMAAGHGQMLPAQLRLEQRMVKRPGQTTRRFNVPVLDVEITPAALISGVTSPSINPPRSTATTSAPALTPVPDTVIEHPAPSILEQLEAPAPRKKRNQVPIPKTGVKPRTADEAQAVANLAGEGMLPDVDCGLTEPADGADELITAAQLTKLSILLREAGMVDREERHDFVAAAIGHNINSAKELTLAEASQVIDILENDRPDDDG